MELLQRTALPPWGGGRCNFSNALPHRLGEVGSENPTTRGFISRGNGESRPGHGHCLKSGTAAMHCLIAWGQRAVQLPQYTASLPRGHSCNALPHVLGAVGSGTPAMHCLTAWGQWGVELLSCTASQASHTPQATPCGFNATPRRSCAPSSSVG